MPADFITADVVADLIGLPSGQAFLGKREGLVEDTGFPLPMPTSTRPLRWRRVEVEAWVTRQGLPKARLPVIPEGSNVRLLNMARAG